MSEYQYYEFLAVDRPLSDTQMRELRALSTRAEISPTRFTNVYHFGDFKGDPDRLMERYFDVHVYVANWGTHELQVRLPRRLVDLEAVARYDWWETVAARVHGDDAILTFRSHDEEGRYWDDEGERWMPSLLPLRAEIAAGDLRAFYLAWLSAVGAGFLEDDEDQEEPPLPPGLGSLPAPLTALAAFLRVDDDLLAAAAEHSPPLESTGLADDELRSWISRLPAGEKDDLLLRLIAADDRHLGTELLQRARRERGRAAEPASDAGRRTVSELLAAAQQRAAERRQLEAERTARERAAYLDDVLGREEQIWREVESLIERKQAQPYDTAVKRLVDLRDAADQAGQAGAFATRLAELRARCAARYSLIERLDRAGLGGRGNRR
jgi:hypothetical protein